jgi:hypothetical protein
MTQPRNVRRTLIAAAVGLVLPVGAAHAVEFLGNRIESSSAANPAYDARDYRSIEFLGNTIPASKPAAEGPVRTERMNDPAVKHEYKRLEFLGNTFWVQERSMTRY